MRAGHLGQSVYIVWLVCVLPGSEGFTVDNEISLKASLLNNSGITTVRPEKTTMVELSFNLLAINKVDIKNEEFGVSGWWSVKWKDSRLSWASSGFGTFPVIQVYSSQIWTPALVVDNSVDDLSAINENTIPLRIRQDGYVTWNPPGILVLSCEMTVTYFPFDSQTCSIQVTSFGYTIQELNLSVHAGLSLSYYQTNGEWEILRRWNAWYQFTDDDYQYAKVAFYVELQRRAVYYGLNTMLPVLLNSLLIPLVFLLPHDAGEKIGYCLTVLLAYVVILTIVTDGLPTTAKSQSLLGVYIAMVLILAAIAVLLTIHSLHIYHRNSDTPVPAWQVRLTRCTFRILRLQCAPQRSPTVCPDEEHPAEETTRNLDRHGTREEVGETLSNVSAIVGEKEEEEEMSWQLVAQAYDAFFLRLYFTIILCSSVAFLVVVASNQF